MSAVPQDTSTEGVPGPESSSEDFKFGTGTCRLPDRDSNHGIRRVSCRAEIDTSPLFESVKEAVIRFGGSGPWVPFDKFGEACHGFEEFDIKKVEEEAAELEKDLIVKELETLDVLEELGTTKKNVEELKRQLKDEALKYMTKTPCLNPDAAPAIEEMNNETSSDEETNISTILRKLEEASEEIKHCKKALKEALESVEIASKKQLDIEDALEKWTPMHEHNNHPRSPLKDLMSKKQVTPQGCVDRTETKKVDLSQMLDELKTDLRFHPKTDHQKHHGDVPKQFFTKFGFIHLHWKSKAKKKQQALNTM